MKKVKLSMTIASLCLAVMVLCFGVFSATNMTYTIGGSISYEVQDVFVKITTNVYKVEGSEPKSQSEMKEDIAELKTKALSSIDTTKYVSSQTNLGVYDSSKEISSGNKNSAEGIDIVYGEDSTGKSYYTYYIVINIENLSSRTDVCAYIEDKTTAEVNSAIATNTYINNISSTNETKNIVIGYSLKDKTQSIDSVAFNYQLTASFEEYVDDYKFSILPNDDSKTAYIEMYCGNEEIVSVPSNVELTQSIQGYKRFNDLGSLLGFAMFSKMGQFLQGNMVNVRYYDSSSNQWVEMLYTVPSDASKLLNIPYPIEVNLGEVTITKEDYQSNGTNCFSIIQSAVNSSLNVYVSCGKNGEKYPRTKIDSSNINNLLAIIPNLSTDDTYFPVQVEIESYTYNQTSNGNGLEVTKIGDMAFLGFDTFSGQQRTTQIEEIILPNTITEIGQGAFEFLSNLKKINIPASVTSIGNNAFDDSPRLLQIRNLSKLNIECCADDIAEILTDNASNFASRFIKSGGALIYVAQNGKSYLAGTSDIKTVTDIFVNDIPDNVTEVLPYAFFDNTTIKKVELSKEIKVIGKYAFYVDNDNFSSCAINTVTFEDYSQLEEIGEYAFAGCVFDNITISGNIKSIKKGAFGTTVSGYVRAITLTNLTIGDKLNIIDGAFNYDSGIVNLPTNMKLVSGSDTFTSGSEANLLNGKTWTVTSA